MPGYRMGMIPYNVPYALTHFHSDHYGGLAASWGNGLIWCTKDGNCQPSPAEAGSRCEVGQGGGVGGEDVCGGE